MPNYKYNQYLILNGKENCFYIRDNGRGKHTVQVNGVWQTVKTDQLAIDGRARKNG